MIMIGLEVLCILHRKLSCISWNPVGGLIFMKAQRGGVCLSILYHPGGMCVYVNVNLHDITHGSRAMISDFLF